MASESNIGQYQNLPSNGPLMNPTQILPQSTTAQQQQQQQQQQAPPPPPHLLQGPPPPPPMSHIASSYPQQQQQQPSGPTIQPGILILGNIPSDLTSREATLIFALVIDEIQSIEMKDYKIYAQFVNINTCITTGKLLDGKYIFGMDYLPVKVEYDNSLNSPNIISTTNAFNQLRLSNSNISPPNINNQQLHHQASNQSLGNGNINQAPQALPPQQQPPQTAPPGTSGGAPAFDMVQKRQSVGNQRSRFVFSDPFSQEGQDQQQQAPSQQQQQPQPQQQQQQQQQQPQTQPQPQPQPQQSQTFIQQSHSVHGGSTPTTTTGPTIDLSDLTGKSILLMESQNDAREYENLVRDTWDSSGVSANLAQQQQQQQQQTQAGDWNNANGANGSTRGDARRTSFFNTGPALNQPQQSQSQQQQQQQPISNLIGSQIPQPLVPQGPTASVLRSTTQPELQSIQHESTSASQSGGPSPPNQYNTPQSYTSTPPGLQPTHVSQKVGSSTSSSALQISTSPTDKQPQASSKDILDLSLLARVPPPANPADQNPPCNTLYVGNLPPDATEAELRTLFSPQKGFRRLSFRTKNQSSSTSSGGSTSTTSHSHGPMCFVEFESIAHATRALADLYGSALPRPGGGNGKGGIRLSFSKNPLGVRGPGNPRRQSSNQVTSGTTGTTTSQSGNGVGNYGYSNYHQK